MKQFWKKQQKKSLENKKLCICPNCGYIKLHTPGWPCRTLVCPECKKSLVKYTDDFDIETKIIHSEAKTRDYPKVNPCICTGCGNCVNACPVEAISLLEGKACIDEGKCRNCRLCQKKCPVEAIY